MYLFIQKYVLTHKQNMLNYRKCFFVCVSTAETKFPADLTSPRHVEVTERLNVFVFLCVCARLRLIVTKNSYKNSVVSLVLQ